MKISYNWLKDYVDVSISPDELAETLTMGGLEVDGVEPIGSSFEGVVVGLVVDVRPHPNADRLTLCDVDVGRGEPLQIACGAPNVAAGQKAPVATVGTTLMLPRKDDPEQRAPVEIKRAKIRGEVSEGMLCAEDELGLSEDHAGIMVLPDDAEIGAPFSAHLRSRGVEPSDSVLDVSITPNRPDAASHIGVARDVAALTGVDFTKPETALPEEGGEAASAVTVEMLTPETCPRYVAFLVRNVSVGDSPDWIKHRLTAIGLRPRNNIVDITNYVMHEVGQPLHAFDFDRVAGATIRVRLTEAETTFVTLDGKKRTLPPDTMMIADGERDVAIAGVMGGENSEVTAATRNVLIESAYFDPTSIRKTAKALGIQTDASYRFERGVDREGQVWAAARAAQLMADVAGGKIVPGMVDAHPKKSAHRTIEVRSSQIDGLLGVHVPVDQAQSLLEAIGFDVERHNLADESRLICTVPTYRPDVEREVDVIEEIVRLYGFDRIPEPPRSVVPNQVPRALPEDRLRGAARAQLSGMGFREIYTNSMLPRELAARFSDPELVGASEDVAVGASEDGAIVATLNPISQEMAALRPSLLPGGLQVMSFNRKHGRRLLRFFEVGHVYLKTDRDDVVVPGYAEHESLLIAASGPADVEGWDVEERLLDIFDLKGAVTSLLESFRLPELDFEPHYDASSVADHQLTILAGEKRIGLLVRLSDDVADSFDLTDPVFVAEIDWQAVVEIAAPRISRQYRRVSRYPVAERDLAVIVDRSESAGPMMKTIREAAGDLLQAVDVFDLYEGERIGEAKRSIAFSLRFGADRTLLDKEVDERVRAALEALEERHGATLRS